MTLTIKEEKINISHLSTRELIALIKEIDAKVNDINFSTELAIYFQEQVEDYYSVNEDLDVISFMEC